MNTIALGDQYDKHLHAAVNNQQINQISPNV